MHMGDFLDMGKYGIYVWPSYGLFIGLLLHMIISPILRHKKIMRELKQIQRRQQAMDEQSSTP